MRNRLLDLSKINIFPSRI